ncbi:iron chaperone [Desertivirga arenae]|uniref:iron chaperone n=1 Tax=Desertivirga arenae TaxID=2810309 RepID=UPI001A95AA3C|nr:DUF1801 domain-containing protein [Pedobacter sp. SYSU D00823]
MDRKAESIEEYISCFSEEVQTILRKIQICIQTIAPDAIQTISYGIPTFKRDNKPLVHFAAFKNHIGFYALPEGNIAFAEKLKGYKVGKGSIQFPLNKPIPFELIEEMVQFRVEELKNSRMSKNLD